jgi:hypothetical protein
MGLLAHALAAMLEACLSYQPAAKGARPKTNQSARYGPGAIPEACARPVPRRNP